MDKTGRKSGDSVMMANAMKMEDAYQVFTEENSTDEFNQLIEEHIVMVKRIAFHLKSKLPEHVHVEDLIQSGMLGLIEAAKKFDQEQGASFETYAGIRIRGAMLDEIRKNDWTPRSVHRNTRMVSEVIKKIENRKGRQSTGFEIADELGVTIDEYHKMLQDTNNHHILSFEDYGYNDESIIDNVPNFQPLLVDDVYKEDMKKLISQSIRDLPQRESLVISLYYDEEMNLREIGAILGVSESRVSQIHAQAVIRLQTKMKSIIEENK